MNKQLIYTAVAPFEAARKVNILPEGHRSSELHGHSFLARVRAILPDDLVTFPGSEVDDLHQALNKQISALDYKYLNEIIAIPTNENTPSMVKLQLYIR